MGSQSSRNANIDEIIESDVELEGEIVEPDNDSPQKMGDPSVEVTEENQDASQSATFNAMEALSEGKLDEAIYHLTEAILLNPKSANLYGTRASVYIKMKKPNAAIRDANAALEINPDSAKGYKSRGVARAMLAQWEEAANDLRLASKLDYDEEIHAVLKKVELNAQRLKEHHRKYEMLREERDAGKLERERRRRRAEAQAEYDKAKKEEQSFSNRKSRGMPGGFPGGKAEDLHRRMMDDTHRSMLDDFNRRMMDNMNRCASDDFQRSMAHGGMHGGSMQGGGMPGGGMHGGFPGGMPGGSGI